VHVLLLLPALLLLIGAPRVRNRWAGRKADDGTGNQTNRPKYKAAGERAKRGTADAFFGTRMRCKRQHHNNCCKKRLHVAPSRGRAIMKQNGAAAGNRGGRGAAI
jgi:hypothetical protein